MINCTVSKNGKSKAWLYAGIFIGFLSGFSYFAVGVYNHSHGMRHGYSFYTPNEYGSVYGGISK